ncbi:hypothetical protein AcV7_000967 [Taiwanofungus camphoratus]|nr:hypothetical protein AcW2_000552 [Antrodia cinnamomea]KAI0962030.1 hypothetical protein AcV7_000967 [Antrodia cinnamomea]
MAVDIFQHIKDEARAIQSSLSAILPLRPSYRPSEVEPPRIYLPIPEPIVSDLVSTGLDSQNAELMSRIYIQAAVRLKKCYERRFHSTVVALGEYQHPAFDSVADQHLRLHAVYLAKYTGILRSWANKASILVRRRVLELTKQTLSDSVLSYIGNRNCTDSHSSRPVFNQDAIPLLDRSFVNNPFPSRSDKLHLANLTGMEYKQIHVWFQNRRNRSRKEGKDVRKTDTGILSPKTSMCRTEVTYPAGASTVQDIDTSVANAAARANMEPVITFNLERPPHAYPSSYPPSCPYNPFPIQEELRSFTTPWIRTKSMPCNHCPAPIDTIQLASLFASMSFVEDRPKEPASELDTQWMTRSCTSMPEGSASAVGFATTAPRAPLSALIPNPDILYKTSQYADHVSQMPSRPSRISKRNVATLPRRTAPNVNPVSGVAIFAESHGLKPSVSCSPTSVTITSNMGNPTSQSTLSCTTPIMSARGFDTNASEQPSFHSHCASRVSTSTRKIAALPQRAPTVSIRPTQHTHAATWQPSSSSSRSTSTASRASSTSSISSSSSSPSSSESEGPLTPPSPPVNLPSPIISTSPLISVPQLKRVPSFDEWYMDGPPSIEGMQLDLLSTVVTERPHAGKNHQNR